MYQQPSMQQTSKPQSYLSSHPQISKRLTSTPTPKLQIPQQQYNRKRQQFYSQQKRANIQLNTKLQQLQHQNSMFKQSLLYFDPTQILQQLQRQLSTTKSRQLSISKQIQHCEIVQRTTTPQEYFLFKKNKRIQTFNQAINQLYEEVDKEREGMRQVMEKLTVEMGQVKGDIERMQGELSNNNINDNNNNNKNRRYNNNVNNNNLSTQRRTQQQRQSDNHCQQQEQNYYYNNNNNNNKYSNNNTYNHNNNRESICQSRVNVIVQSTLSQNHHHQQHQQHQQHEQQQQQYNIYINNTQNKDSDSSSSSQSQSSIEPYQLQHLKQQYKSLLQTYEIISQNNQIMTTQLFNNIQSIQDSLYKYHDTQTNKLYRDLLLIKEDFSYMPLQHIIPPTQTQLNYQVTPLIHDYKNRLNQIKNKLSTDLKRITADILTPIQWENISISQYLQIDLNENNQDDDNNTQNNFMLKSSTKTNKQSQSSKTNKNVIKQAQKQYQRIQAQIQKQDQIISSLQQQLQLIMGDTMVFKQKQHQLQLAMNNMRKTLRETQKQQSQQTILF